jgi:AAHS family 4-hydroxybenzoate transporter-like MFS transporter
MDISIQQELAEARIGSAHKALCAIMALVTLLDGYDTFNPAYVIHYVTKPWGLTPGTAGLLISSGLIGFLIGSIAHGPIADRLGRRATLLTALWIVNIFTVATALLGDGFVSFCILRVLTGVGLGTLLPLSTTYINELAPTRVSNGFSLFGVGLGWSMGGALAGIVGVFLTPNFGWQVLYWFGSLSILLTIALHLALPESPKFLARAKRTEELTALLARLRPERAQVYARATLLTAEEGVPSRAKLAALLTPAYRRTTLSIWSTAFLSLFVIFGLTGWIPTVMMQRGETFAASFGFGALMQVMSFVGGIVLAIVADRRVVRTERLMALWWGLGSAAVISLVVLNDHLCNFLLVAAAGFFAIGAQFVLNNFTANVYPTSIRASGVGMELGIGRVGAILGPSVAGYLQQATGTSSAMFWAIGGVGFLAAAIMGGPAVTSAKR